MIALAPDAFSFIDWNANMAWHLNLNQFVTQAGGPKVSHTLQEPASAHSALVTGVGITPIQSDQSHHRCNRTYVDRLAYLHSIKFHTSHTPFS